MTSLKDEDQENKNIYTNSYSFLFWFQVSPCLKKMITIIGVPSKGRWK